MTRRRRRGLVVGKDAGLLVHMSRLMDYWRSVWPLLKALGSGIWIWAVGRGCVWGTVVPAQGVLLSLQFLREHLVNGYLCLYNWGGECRCHSLFPQATAYETSHRWAYAVPWVQSRLNITPHSWLHPCAQSSFSTWPLIAPHLSESCSAPGSPTFGRLMLVEPVGIFSPVGSFFSYRAFVNYWDFRADLFEFLCPVTMSINRFWDWPGSGAASRLPHVSVRAGSGTTVNLSCSLLRSKLRLCLPMLPRERPRWEGVPLKEDKPGVVRFPLALTLSV